jgi:hypothetical protein
VSSGVPRNVDAKARIVRPYSGPSWRTYDSPPLSCASIGCGGSAARAGTRSISSAMITATNEKPLAVKQKTLPSVASAMPASSGPMTRARLNWMELSAIAFGRSFFSTSDGTSDW